MGHMNCKFIQTKGFNAFVCGMPKDHKCNSEGEPILMIHNSRYVMLLKDFENLPDDLKEEQYKVVSGGSVTCSICGESAFENFNINAI